MSALVTTHTADGLDSLLEQFSGSVNLRHLLSSYLDRIQEFETAVQPIIDARDIDVATDDRLDGMGDILLVDRAGRSDADYRLRLRAEMAILRSRGTEEDLTTVLQLLLGMASKDIDYAEYFPKVAYLRGRNHDSVGFQADQAITLTLLTRAAPAGTELHYIYSLDQTDDDNMFRFSDTADTTETSATYGTENGTLCGAAE